MKINEFKNQYLNSLAGREKAESTKQAYDFDLTKFISYLKSKGISEAKDITTLIIEDYLFGLKVSSSTKQRRKVVIKTFFDFLYKHGEISNNPAVNVESIKVTQKRPEYLSSEQYTNFLKTIEKDSTPYYKKRDLMLVKILIMTGLRRAEIVRLNVGDVDLSKLRFSVKRKGNREEYVIIHNKLVEDLRNYLKIINRYRDEPLFMSKRGQRLSASSVWHLIKVYSKKAGLNGDVTVHSLRHTFATALLSENVQLPYIQQLMGHRSAQTTSRYLHIQDNQLSEAFNRVTFEGRR